MPGIGALASIQNTTPGFIMLVGPLLGASFALAASASDPRLAARCMADSLE